MTRTLTSIAVLAFATAPAFAETVAPTDVVYGEYGEVETSLTGVAGNPAEGAKIMTTRSLGNCIACHEVTALKDSPFHGEVGPMLDGVGEYRSAGELRGIVINAKQSFEGTVMPAYYKIDGFNRPGDAYTGKAAKGELSPLLSAQQIEDVVAFLLTLKE